MLERLRQCTAMGGAGKTLKVAPRKGSQGSRGTRGAFRDRWIAGAEGACRESRRLSAPVRKALSCLAATCSFEGGRRARKRPPPDDLKSSGGTRRAGGWAAGPAWGPGEASALSPSARAAWDGGRTPERPRSLSHHRAGPRWRRFCVGATFAPSPPRAPGCRGRGERVELRAEARAERLNLAGAMGARATEAPRAEEAAPGWGSARLLLRALGRWSLARAPATSARLLPRGVPGLPSPAGK